jgi:hypothetical protein
MVLIYVTLKLTLDDVNRSLVMGQGKLWPVNSRVFRSFVSAGQVSSRFSRDGGTFQTRLSADYLLPTKRQTSEPSEEVCRGKGDSATKRRTCRNPNLRVTP